MMLARHAIPVLLSTLIVVLLGTVPAQAQLGSLKKKAEEKLKKEAEKKVDPKAAETPAPADTGAAPADNTAVAGEPGKGPWLNYDFVPGAKVLFFEDFSKDQVGNFPQRFEFIEGNMEVAEWNNMRWLRASTASKFSIPLPQDLPQKFTLEFDFYGQARGWSQIFIYGGDDSHAEQSSVLYDITNVRAGLRKGGQEVAMADVDESAFSNVIHARVLGDGAYLKVYFNEKRVANIPNANFVRSNKLYLDILANEDRPMLMGNFRVAFSEKTMYDAIAADGRCTTHGILFDSGSDRIRPESTPTLKEIGQMLKDHADLKLAIEGHTDNVGDDASNQSLSEKRAAAVVAYLVANYGVDVSRLQSKGLGETVPCAPNDTAEGRQNNRRVELVKI